jgi:hypothetical protein
MMHITELLHDGNVIMEPYDNDVLSGRGHGQTHVGTKAYRGLVQGCQEQYSMCPEGDKSKISKFIVSII